MRRCGVARLAAARSDGCVGPQRTPQAEDSYDEGADAERSNGGGADSSEAEEEDLGRAGADWGDGASTQRGGRIELERHRGDGVATTAVDAGSLLGYVQAMLGLQGCSDCPPRLGAGFARGPVRVRAPALDRNAPHRPASVAAHSSSSRVCSVLGGVRPMTYQQQVRQHSPCPAHNAWGWCCCGGAAAYFCCCAPGAAG